MVGHKLDRVAFPRQMVHVSTDWYPGYYKVTLGYGDYVSAPIVTISQMGFVLDVVPAGDIMVMV